MKSFAPVILALPVLISACSSSSSSSSGGGSEQNALPDTLPNRIVRIDTDVGKDGSTEVVSSMSYDGEGRLSRRTIDFSDELQITDTESDYLYSDGNLVEIRSGNTLEMFTYENNLLVEYLNTDGISEEQNSFRYDGNGRLTGTSGFTRVYSASDCFFNFEDLPETEPDLMLNYANGRLSSITSANGVLNEIYTYDAASRISSITSNYTCPDSANNFSTVLEFNYDSNGRPASIEQSGPDGLLVAEISRDSSGRTIELVTTDSDPEFGTIFSIDTQTITYNDQGLPATVETSTVPESRFSPDIIATFTYEAQSCKVALTANPLTMTASAALRTTTSDNDPSLCLFPLDDGGF